MAWARIDDRFHDHPKAVGLDLAAVGLWTFCLTWTHSNRSGKIQGHIPPYLPRRFGAAPELAEQLVEAGLWHQPGHTCTCPAIETGWLIHDYVDYLPLSTRRSRSEAGKRGAAARWAKKSQDAMASCHEVDSKPIANHMAKDDSRAHARRVTVGSSSEGSSSVAVREDVLDLCSLLADRIQANGSKRPTITKAWHDSCRLMLDRDGRSPAQVRKAIEWSQHDEFWRTNILSMPKLREKYEQLRLAAQRNGQGSGKVAETLPLGVPEHMLRR